MLLLFLLQYAASDSFVLVSWTLEFFSSSKCKFAVFLWNCISFCSLNVLLFGSSLFVFWNILCHGWSCPLIILLFSNFDWFGRLPFFLHTFCRPSFQNRIHYLILLCVCFIGSRKQQEQKLFNEYLGKINSELSYVQLELRACRNQYDGCVYYGVVNNVSDDPSKLGTKYSVPQIAFYKGIVRLFMMFYCISAFRVLMGNSVVIMEIKESSKVKTNKILLWCTFCFEKSHCWGVGLRNSVKLNKYPWFNFQSLLLVIFSLQKTLSIIYDGNPSTNPHF